MLISFLSSGSVLNIEEIPIDANSPQSPAFLILPYGGYLVVYNNKPNNTTSVVESFLLTGYILDDKGKLSSEWSFPFETLPAPCIPFYNKVNNDIHIISEITPNNLTIITSNIQKFIDDGKLIFI